MNFILALLIAAIVAYGFQDLSLGMTTVSVAVAAFSLLVANLSKVPTAPRPKPVASFDFRKLKVFSIERESGKTVIGYKGVDGDIDTWVMDCDLASHSYLVAKFNLAVHGDEMAAVKAELGDRLRESTAEKLPQHET